MSSKVFFPSVTNTTTLYEHPFSATRAALCICPTNSTRWFKYDRDYLCVNKSQFVPVIFEPPCIILDVVTLTILDDEYKLWGFSSWYRLYFFVTSFLSDPDILLNILFQNIVIHVSFIHNTDQVLHPQNTSDKN
jgi:hypothetical protein